MTPGQIKRLMSSKGFVLKRQGGEACDLYRWGHDYPSEPRYYS
jgi:hypothetical protein